MKASGCTPALWFKGEKTKTTQLEDVPFLYYVGIHGISPSTNTYLFVDNIALSAAYVPLTIMLGKMANLNMYLSLTMPMEQGLTAGRFIMSVSVHRKLRS